jgi:outer membrane protein OmpA-like peptidoglycan-associated protein
MCPFQSGALALNGCPDRDGDAIADLIDKCPDIMGDATAEGCPDADGDGIKDEDDRCPETAGLAAMAGCPDTDEDGITDAEDECPNVPGRADLKGCPFPDKDRDGLADEKDKCPNEAGPEALSGCPDTDADGIVDIDDRCPDTLGVAGFSGCPAPSAELLEILKQAAKNVQFETGSAVLKPISVQELTKVTAILQEYPYFHLRISGHTDSQGNDKANQTLSEKRAAACRDQLIANGIDQMRLLSVGFGESHPIANNATPEGRRQNRRVEFELFTP